MVGLVLAASVVALVIAVPCAMAAAVPVGPRLTFFEAEFVLNEPRSEAEEDQREVVRFVSTDTKGDDLWPLPAPPSVRVRAPAVSWDADGGEFAFLGKKAGTRSVRAYISAADGTGAHPIAGTTGATRVVLSPDGQWLACSRWRKHRPRINPKDPDSIIESLTHSYSSETTWIVPIAGGTARRLTPWGNGRFSEPSSFSPDGSTLAFTVDRIGARAEVDIVDLATGRRRTLEAEASEAAYSPDGSEIAFVSYRDRHSVRGFDEHEATSELYVARADGTGARRITDTPTLEETAPSWDPSGARLAYLRAPGGMFGLIEGRPVESNGDGSCPLLIPVSKPRRKRGEMYFDAPTWWPGAGRGAGPISC